MTDKKRSRIEKKQSLPTTTAEPVEVHSEQELNLAPFQEAEQTWLTPDGDFDWEAYEATCISRVRKPNPHIKTQKGDRVYSRESYAQEMYDLINGHSISTNLRPNLSSGEIVDGIIHAISKEWLTVDVNYRELIYVKLSKEPANVVVDFKPGDSVSVLVLSKDEGSQVFGSISGGMKQRIFRDLQAGIESADTAWVGNVTAMIENGGYIVNVQGIECFMPGSLAGINKLHDFNSIVGQQIYIVPVSFSPERGTIVVSHRKYLQALIPGAIQDLKANIEQKHVGSVTGSAKYGVFVEFNECLTGMIHANDLDEATMQKFKSREIKPGDSIEFWVKDVISNSKITLSQKSESIDNPWNDIEKRFKVPSTVEATVKTKKDYGLFISIEKGLVGLLHVSELEDNIMELYNPGDKITVQINRIDKDSQKIFLSLPS
jgi:small subunit ribosomal protein S1